MQHVTLASTKWSDDAGERELCGMVMSNAHVNYRAILRADFSVFNIHSYYYSHLTYMGALPALILSDGQSEDKSALYLK